MRAAKVIHHRGFTIRLYQDETAESPRTMYENLGTMACWHRRYNLGDVQPKESSASFQIGLICEFDEGFEERHQRKTDAVFTHAFEGGKSVEQAIEEADDAGRRMIAEEFEKYYLSLPLYLYDHSGITMNPSGFSCPWDSGQVGFIYLSKADARKEYGLERLSRKARERAEKVLIGEVKTYDQFLTGDVWGYVIVEGIHTEEDEDVEEFDSCWGYFGQEYCIQEAEDMIDAHLDRQETA